MSDTKVKRVRNIDRTDLEILGLIKDLGADATSTEIGLRLGFSTNGKKSITPAGKVGSRLGAMRRGGLLERTEPQRRGDKEPGSSDSIWEPSAIGHALLSGKLSAAVINAFERAHPGQQILMMRQLTQRAYVKADAPVAWAVRREYAHQAAQRSR